MARTPIEKFLEAHQPELIAGEFVYRNLPAQGLVDAIKKTIEPPEKKKGKKKKKTGDPVAQTPGS